MNNRLRVVIDCVVHTDDVIMQGTATCIYRDGSVERRPICDLWHEAAMIIIHPDDAPPPPTPAATN